MTHTVRSFDSLEAYQAAFEGEKQYHRWDTAEDWTHGIDGDTAVRMITEGWSEAVKDLADALDAPSLAIPTIGEEFDIAGGRPDVGRYLAGEPENMVNYVDDPEFSFQGKHLDIFCSMSVASGVENEYIINRGRAILSVVRGLIESNASVTLWGIHSFDIGAGSWTVLVKLYDGTGPYHVGQLAFMLSHPAVQRHLTHELEARDERADLSRVGPLCTLAHARGIPGAILFPQVTSDYDKWGTFENAKRTVSAIIDQVGRTAAFAA